VQHQHYDATKMISLIRSFFAFALSLVLTTLTFGRVELNRTGGATTEDDSLGSSRPAASRQSVNRPLLFDRKLCEPTQERHIIHTP
jgi:hypothetical protein